MITSKLSSKARTTIPDVTPAALHLKEGDDIVSVVEDDRASIMTARPLPVDDPFVTFGEWGGEADHKAYTEL